MMVIDNEYEHGQIVYLITDKEQEKRIVIAFTIYKAGEIMYKLVCGETHSEHYAFEMSADKDLELA